MNLDGLRNGSNSPPIGTPVPAEAVAVYRRKAFGSRPYAFILADSFGRDRGPDQALKGLKL